MTMTHPLDENPGLCTHFHVGRTGLCGCSKTQQDTTDCGDNHVCQNFLTRKKMAKSYFQRMLEDLLLPGNILSQKYVSVLTNTHYMNNCLLQAQLLPHRSRSQQLQHVSEHRMYNLQVPCLAQFSTDCMSLTNVQCYVLLTAVKGLISSSLFFKKEKGICKELLLFPFSQVKNSQHWCFQKKMLYFWKFKQKLPSRFHSITSIIML